MIRVGIMGYGNLGRGVECALSKTKDMELIGIFSRRDPASITPHDANTPVYTMEAAIEMKDRIDVMILCGGSAKDLPEQTKELPNISMLLIALIHMRKFLSILQTSITARKQTTKLR